MADRVTVLRRGRVAALINDPRRAGEKELARLMVGELPEEAKAPASKPGRVVLRVRELRVEVDGVERVKGVSFDVREGEVVGLAGVAGNGQEELVEAIIGVRRPSGGFVEVAGKRVRSPRDYYSQGGGYIPGDRAKALALDMSVSDNIAFIYNTVSRALLLDGKTVESLYRLLEERFKLVAGGPSVPAGRLSGGNQQKLLVGSEILRGFKILVAVNPTQGLDVATTRFVRTLIAELAERGVGVLLVSTDLDEVLELSNRILVMSGGRITGSLSRDEASPERLGVLMGA